MIKCNDDFSEPEEIEFLVNPMKEISPKITEITGLKNDDLSGIQPFPYYYDLLCEKLLGVKTLIAHNAAFDCEMLKFELMRIKKVLEFPWPPQRICTVEATYHIKNRRMKLTQLYEHLLKKPLEQKHRAINDCRDLLEVCIELRKKKLL